MTEHLPDCWCSENGCFLQHVNFGRFNGTLHWGRTAGLIALRPDINGLPEVVLVSKGKGGLDFPKGKRGKKKEESAWDVARREWYSETGLNPCHLSFFLPYHVFVDAVSGCHYFLASWEGGLACPQQWTPWPERRSEGKPVMQTQWVPIRAAYASEELGQVQKQILTRVESHYADLTYHRMQGFPPMPMPMWLESSMPMQIPMPAPSIKSSESSDSEQEQFLGKEPFLAKEELELGFDEYLGSNIVSEPPLQTGWELDRLLLRAPATLLGDQEQCESVKAILNDGSDADRQIILDWVCQDVLSLSEDQHACWVVQHLFEHVDKSGCSRLCAKIGPHTQRLLDSMYGNHVLAKSVECALTENDVRLVIHHIRKMGLVVVANHRFGCRLCERLIEHHGRKDVMSELLDELVRRSEEMCKNRYGNYVLQSILDQMPQRQKEMVFNLHTSVATMAKHRFASHLAQKMIQLSEPKEMLLLARAIICASDPCLAEIASNRFGAFVIKDLLEALFGDEVPEKDRQMLIQEVKSRLATASQEWASSEHFETVRVRFVKICLEHSAE